MVSPVSPKNIGVSDLRSLQMPRRFSVNLTSSRGSIRRSEPSVLAIGETLVASGLSLWLAWQFESIRHIAIASFIVPFLLIRTRSTDWLTLTFLYSFEKKLTEKLHIDTSATVAAIAIPAIKIYSTTRVFIRHPFLSLLAIPENYYINIFVVDSMHSPQIFPGFERVKHLVPLHFRIYISEMADLRILVRTFIDSLREDRRLGAFRFLVMSFGMAVVLLPAIISSILYRWSLKSTALIWLPLVWVVIQSRSGKKVSDRLRMIRYSFWSKAMLFYTAIVLFAFLAKLALLFGAWELVNLHYLGPVGDAATRLIAPFELPAWQIAGALNGLLAIIFFIRADQHLLLQDMAEAKSENWIKKEYAIFQIVRTSLSLYIIACTFYITAAIAWQMELPPIQIVLFPWSA